MVLMSPAEATVTVAAAADIERWEAALGADGGFLALALDLVFGAAWIIRVSRTT